MDNKQNINHLVEQIRCIILNKPISDDMRNITDEFCELQEALDYLSNCISEANGFVEHLAKGELNIEAPGRYNFLAGYLKELHSGLKHLTWQTHQIAQGDYAQRVSFLGEFSVAFNQMVTQLRDRETKLKEQSEILSKTSMQMKAIMDGVNDSIIVTSYENSQVLYANKTAQKAFFKYAKNGSNNDFDLFLNTIIDYHKNNMDDNKNSRYEYVLEDENKILNIDTFEIYWDNNYALVHYISDITNQKKEQKKLESMSFKDELTGLYNRRYCYKILKEYLVKNVAFCFCMVDLDGLKYANDNFGHSAGDEYLRTVSMELLKMARLSDTVSRLGGDEFVLIFPQCSADIVAFKMESVDKNLHAKKCDYPMSISYGVVSVDENNVLAIEELIAKADERMYKLKTMHHKRRK